MNVGIHAERLVKYYYAESQDSSSCRGLPLMTPTLLLIYQHTVTRGAENILNVNEKRNDLANMPVSVSDVLVHVMLLH